jgi:amidase
MALTYPYCLEWNLTGQPALAVPAGQSDDGVPIGVQPVGRHDEEATLLAQDAQLETERGWPERRPAVS